jgi:hypothetical protein
MPRHRSGLAGLDRQGWHAPPSGFGAHKRRLIPARRLKGRFEAAWPPQIPKMSPSRLL